MDPIINYTTPAISESSTAMNTTLVLHTNNANQSSGEGTSADNNPRYILLLGLLPMVLMTVIANVLVMVVIKRDTKLQNSSNWYIFSLAVADAIVGLAVMLPFSVYNIYLYWPWGVLPCTIWICFDFACCTVSMLHLCLIAFDRLQCIVQPHTYIGEEAKKRTITGIIFGWFVGFVVWIPAIVLFRQKDVYDGTMDETDCLFFPPKEYILVQSILVYFGPIFAMIILYIELVKSLNEKEERLKQHIKHKQKEKNTGDGHTNAAFVNEEPEQITKTKTEDTDAEERRKTKLERKMSKQNSRSVKVIGVVIMTFLVCWLPFCVFWPIAAFCESCIGARLYEASYWLAYLNSLINPLLYFIVNRDFRRALVNLCGWQCCRNNKFVSDGSTIDNTPGVNRDQSSHLNKSHGLQTPKS